MFTPTPKLNRSALSSLAVGLGASALMGSLPGCSERPETIPDSLASPNFTLRELIMSPEEAIQMATAGIFAPECYELENLDTGTFTYVFEAKDSEQKHILRGIPIGSERNSLLQGLRVAEMTVVPGVMSVSGDIPTGFFQKHSQSLVLLGGLAVVLGAGMVWANRRINTAPGNSGRTSGAELKDIPPERFSDIGGLTHLLPYFQELAGDIRSWMKGDKSVVLPKGDLLVGPPGTGKTLSMRALAGEAQCGFYLTRCGDIVSDSLAGAWTKNLLAEWNKCISIGEQLLKQLRSAPGATGEERAVVVFLMDEFKAVGKARDKGSKLTDIQFEHSKMVEVLLALMDGLETTNQNPDIHVMVLAADNDESGIDPALMRPSRFRNVHKYNIPESVEERRDVLGRLKFRELDQYGVTLETPGLLDDLAKLTQGKSGDVLKGILVEARDIARRDGERKILDAKDLMEALQRRDHGRIKTDKVNPKKLDLVAYHEVGRAIAAISCEIEPYVVSMCPRGDTLGRIIPDPGIAFESPLVRDEYLQQILMYSGGRAGELLFGGFSTASDAAREDFVEMKAILSKGFASGMFPDFLASTAIADGHFTREELDIYSQVVFNAIRTNYEMLERLKPKIESLVEQVLKLERELVGPEAQELFKVIDSRDREMLRECREGFLMNPSGVTVPKIEGFSKPVEDVFKRLLEANPE